MRGCYLFPSKTAFKFYLFIQNLKMFQSFSKFETKTRIIVKTFIFISCSIIFLYLQSVSREGRDHALSATYVQSPYDENLDWKLAATMSPCHVKVTRPEPV